MTTSISTSIWLDKISKELKGRSINEFDWLVAADIRISPFAHADDSWESQMEPLFFDRTEKNDWQIVEKIIVDNIDVANKKALAALSSGIDRIDFEFKKLPNSESDFQRLFESIFLEMIAVTFSGEAVKTNASAFIFWFENLAKSKNIDPRKLIGAFDFDLSGWKDWRFLADLMIHSSEKLPLFRLLTIQTDETDGAYSLSDLLKKVDVVVRELSQKGLSPKDVLPFLQFKISIGPHFLTEIARLRAFQIIWMNWQKASDFPVSRAPISVVFQKNAYSEDANLNMIRATEMTLAAAIGGAEQIFIEPFSKQGNDTYGIAFQYRIARNVQHILKMESFIGRAEDPVAGSYFIENLTSKIAASAWKHFEKKVNVRGLKSNSKSQRIG